MITAKSITHGEIKFAIVGCGNIAPFHIDAIAQTDGAKLVALCDTDITRASELARIHGCTAFSDFTGMLQSADFDVVNICLPSSLHEKFAIAAANAGKHVIVEKPLDITMEKCDSIIFACQSNDVKLSVIFPNRFKKAVRLLHHAISIGRFGKLTLADAQIKWFRAQSYYDSASWRGTWAFDGGGVLMNQSIHYIDILQHLMGPVESVSARCATLARKIEVEDTAVAVMKFSNGALGVVEATTVAHPGLDATIAIHGDKGSAMLQGEAIVQWDFEDKMPGDDEVVSMFSPTASSGAKDPVANLNSDGHRLQIEDMVQAIRENRTPAVDGYEGRKSVGIIQAIYRSSRENARTVTIDNLFASTPHECQIITPRIPAAAVPLCGAKV